MDALILGESPNALSAARSLGRRGLEVMVLADRVNRALESSRYVSRFELLEARDDAEVCAFLLGRPQRAERPFLLATGDRWALLVAEHQERLKARYRFVCPSYATLAGIIDKAKLYESATRSGFPCPKFYVVEGKSDIEAAVAAVSTPCFVKPALAHRWRAIRNSKVERAGTADELRRILAVFVEMGMVAVPQEIIPGDDSQIFSVAAYIDRRGDCVGWRTKRKLRQWPIQAGDGSLQEICEQPEVADLGLRLLTTLGHRGPATVEFRRDQRDGRFVLIEINARTILGQEMVTRSGFDVPWTAYCDATDKPVPKPGPPRRVRWIALGPDYRAFRALHKQRAITIRGWLRSIITCNAFAYFAVNDPLPFMTRALAWCRRRIQKQSGTASSNSGSGGFRGSRFARGRQPE
jgi:predicted ATP-grasp superfamily ATP-dependent carboligase